MKNYLSIANSTLMFIACGIVIIYVLGQSLFFMRRAWKRGKEIGMDTNVMKKTVSTRDTSHKEVFLRHFKEFVMMVGYDEFVVSIKVLWRKLQ